MSRRPLFLFPLPREAGPFRRRYPNESTAIIGMGHTCADNIRKLLDGEVPTAAILAGFAGSLRPEIEVGRVVFARAVIDATTGESWPVPICPHANPGKVLWSSRAVGDPTEKIRLGAEFGADIVDMESAHFARACSERGIPWGVVRAVSDGVTTAIPADVLRLIESGHVRWSAALAALIRCPGVARDFWRLARDSAVAARALAAAIDPQHIMSS